MCDLFSLDIYGSQALFVFPLSNLIYLTCLFSIFGAHNCLCNSDVQIHSATQSLEPLTPSLFIDPIELFMNVYNWLLDTENDFF